jgi:hypothetical protein
VTRQDAWGARAAAEGTDWGRYLSAHLGSAGTEPDLDDPAHAAWQRFMRLDCLHLASVVGAEMRLPVGRLLKGDQLAHAFVILPNHDGVPDRWPCLDWSGVRSLKQVREDLRHAWGRLAFDWNDTRPLTRTRLRGDRREIMRLARGRPHIARAMRLAWPRVSTSLHGYRLRYLDVIDSSAPVHRVRRRKLDIIDVG